MDQFTVEFYETAAGERPAEEFLDSLDVKMRGKLVMTLKVLQEQGNRLREPYSKLENGTRNPSLKLLKRLADGMGMDLKLVFTPKKNGHLPTAQ